MMTPDPQDGWHYDHWFHTPRSRRRGRGAGAILIGLFCALMAGGGVGMALHHVAPHPQPLRRLALRSPPIAPFVAHITATCMSGPGQPPCPAGMLLRSDPSSQPARR